MAIGFAENVLILNVSGLKLDLVDNLVGVGIIGYGLEVKIK